MGGTSRKNALRSTQFHPTLWILSRETCFTWWCTNHPGISIKSGSSRSDFGLRRSKPWVHHLTINTWPSSVFWTTQWDKRDLLSPSLKVRARLAPLLFHEAGQQGQSSPPAMSLNGQVNQFGFSRALPSHQAKSVGSIKLDVFVFVLMLGT